MKIKSVEIKQKGQYLDDESASWLSECWSCGHSFFCYQSDSVDALASCCRLRNAVESNVFSYTLGAGGIETGSKCVVTLNLNRITQDWDRAGRKQTLPEYITPIVERVHAYLNAWNSKLWDDYNAGLLTVYKAGFINLDKQYLTVGVNGFLEGAEALGIKPDPDNEEYKKFAHETLGTIKALNAKARTEHSHFNQEMIPAENAGAKLYEWDKEDGYKVNPNRNIYNSYFFPVEDTTIDPIKKFYFQGNGFASECDGGVANHVNLNESLSKSQYRHLMDVAVKAGCSYFSYNIPMTICNQCGHIDKRMLTECPECGSHNLDYATRVIGYLKRVSNFSEARQKEAKKRYYTSESTVEKDIGK
jgi:anaerobic ribonucleoside-triphosphate reductase